MLCRIRFAYFYQTIIFKGLIMKFSQIALAVASTLIAAQAFAAPVTPAEIAAAGASAQKTWISGASAPTYNIFRGFTLGCDANTVTVFHNSSSTSAIKPGSTGDYNAYACKRSGVVSVLYVTAAGGSFNAYAPHIDGTQLSRIRNVASNASCVKQASQLVIEAGNNADVYRACAIGVGATVADAAPTLPSGGFSDVEAALFERDVTSVGTEADANVGQAFGVAVSTNLYRALQVAQGKYATVAAANAGDPTFTPENAPNISSAQYTSIIAAGSGYQTDWSPILGAAGNGKKIVLVRRVSTSGTQASSNAHFLQKPCAGTSALTPAGVANSIAGAFEVSEQSGTSGVKAAMTTANNAGDFAIGVMSLENDWRRESSAANAQYRFLKLDGVHPEAGSSDGTTFVTPVGSLTVNNYTARKTSVDGDYRFHMELKSFVANTADTFGAEIIPEIAASLGNPVDCADVPRGLTLNPLGGSSCNAAPATSLATAPFVAKGTRFGNNCQVPQLF